ncbi:MAG: DNA repair protein RadC [Acidobacteria bacterium]|nr:DNA repair protein RadC [Acidobacteriota bacterium]
MSCCIASYLPEYRVRHAGWDSLSELELLALLIGPGVSPRKALQEAQRLLDRFQSARAATQATYHQLRKEGLNHRQALALQASVHLFQRIRQSGLNPGQVFRSSVDIFEYFQPQLEPLKKECFWSVLLDGKNRLISLVRISEGSLTCSLVHPREVFRPAIREAAAGVLFVHNHPSGDPAPSQEDIEITRRLVETGRIIGIRALDHVIIGARDYFSFADRGVL